MNETVATGIRARNWRISTPLALVALSFVIYVGAALATGETSQLSFQGLAGLLQRMVALGLVAIGQTFALLIASIDMSVAAVMSAVAVLASYIMQGDPAMIGPAILVCLAFCAAVGIINGVLVSVVGVNPLIATLGVGLVIQGVLSAAFAVLPGRVAPGFQAFAYSGFIGVPWSVITLFALAAGASVLLNRTVFGARVFAVGGNPDSARLAGVRTARVTICAHVICSLFAGLAGLYLAARLQSGTPWVGREGLYDLESIAVSVIGGTLLAGGKGGVAGTMAGVLLFACLDAGFNMLGIDAFLKQVLRGGVIVAAVAVHSVRQKGHVA